MQFPQDLKYSKDHEWVRYSRGIATVGVTDFAQDALGDVVYVSLPERGRALAVGETAAEIESVKAVSEVFSPVAGKVVEVNEGLEGSEDAINRDPYGDGWLFKVEVSDPGAIETLMDVAAYQAFVAERAH